MAVGEFSGDDREGECVPSLGPREGADGDPRSGAPRTETFLSDSPSPALSLQPSLPFPDFVAGVPKGNLTYGYVRPSLTLPPLTTLPCLITKNHAW